MSTSSERGHAALDAGLAEAARLVAWMQGDAEARDTLLAMARDMAACLRAGGRLISCGNGGSMCDAMHFAEELSGRYDGDRPALSAMAISDPSHLTCTANDYGFERVFARGVEAWGREGDVLLCFSTSGNSPNVRAAADAAHERGMVVHALLGKTGGALREQADLAIVVPAGDSGRVQELHIKCVHLLIGLIEAELFPAGTG